MMMEKLGQGELIPSFETRRMTKDGRILDVWLTVTALKDESGRPYAISMTERDITERKRTMEELQTAKEELEVQTEERMVRADDLNKKITDLENEPCSQISSIMQSSIPTPLSP